MSFTEGGFEVSSRVSDEVAIWRLATAMSAAASSSDVATALAEQGARAAGATFSNMAIFEPEASRVRVVHGSTLDRLVAARWSSLGIGEQTPLCHAILSGRPVLLGSLDEIGKHYPNLVRDTVTASLASTASIPLRTTGDACLGAIGFGWSVPQRFDINQIQRLDLIAHLAAQALERALLYEREKDRDSARDQAEAHLLQEAFLPRELPRSDGLELAATYLPASDAPMGGDWYDAFPVERGVCLVIGDAAGHGLRSAAVMAQLRNAVRAFAVEDPSPAWIVTRLNKMLCHLEPDETATAIVAIWDSATGTISRSNAGHPPILRCRRNETGYLFPAASNVLLGVDPDWAYSAESKTLRPGTTLLFYTDGLVETRGQGLDEGLDGLRVFIDGLADLSPQALCDNVLDWRLAAGRREDDMCLLAARLTVAPRAAAATTA